MEYNESNLTYICISDQGCNQADLFRWLDGIITLNQFVVSLLFWVSRYFHWFCLFVAGILQLTSKKKIFDSLKRKKFKNVILTFIWIFITFQTIHSCYWVEGLPSCFEEYNSCSFCPPSIQVKTLPVVFLSSLFWSPYFYQDLKTLNMISLALLFQLLNMQKVSLNV